MAEAPKATELDRRLKRFARRLRRRELEGVKLHDGCLQISPVEAASTPEPVLSRTHSERD